MSNPKLNFKEETSAQKTRSPPKKARVEQSTPKKKKLKLDADKAAEKNQHLQRRKIPMMKIKKFGALLVSAVLCMGKVARIAANFSEYIANEPKVSYRDGRYFVFDGQNTIEARKTCNGGRDLPIRCKVFYGLSKEHEALLFAVQTGISSELTAGEQLRAKLVAHEENACDFVSVTEDTGVRFALDGIRAPWKIYCIRSAYYIYKSYGASLYREMLSVLVDAWGGDSDSFLSGILHGMARFLALYQGEYSRERLILRLRTVHPKTITRLAQNDTGNVADRHMKQILSIYNGAGRAHSLPCKR